MTRGVTAPLGRAPLSLVAPAVLAAALLVLPLVTLVVATSWDTFVDHLLDPAFRQEWIDRWGTVATPLLWSHAMLLRLAVELGEVVA